MPRTDDPYSRVYWRAVDDSKFAKVWPDDRALATWLRLLVAADQAWPASAALPLGVSKVGLRTLVDVQLVDLSGPRFRIRGLDAERERRSLQGKAGAAAKKAKANRSDEPGEDEEPPTEPGPARTPRKPNGSPDGYRTVSVGTTNGVPSQEETRQEEPSREETREKRARAAMPSGFDDDTEGPALTWLAQHGVHFISSSDGRLHRLIQLVERHGSDQVIATFDLLARAGVQDGDSAGFVFKAEDALRGPRPSVQRVREIAEGDRDRKASANRQVATERRIAEQTSIEPPSEEAAAAGFAAMREAIGGRHAPR